ncbi:MAG: MOSC domain-containing protein [Acidobacteriales bacterium]|nr:MOSC domain-containing protein [Terriglobales bacterium]
MQSNLASVVSLWRYPVKSMMGEELNAADFNNHGLLGDRAYALIDLLTGKVASAKNPKKWPDLFHFRASYIEPPQPGGEIPPVWITFPDGTIRRSTDADLNEMLSRHFGRKVKLTRTSSSPSLEEYWPNVEGLSHREIVTDEKMPEGTFFDSAVAHVLSTNTLDTLRSAYPQGRFEVRRFRPNLVVQLNQKQEGFVENGWIGEMLALGDVRLSITGPCPRCVMTTLSQGDLPQDLGILKTAAKQNRANIGAYASVAKGGLVRRGDLVMLEQPAVAAT